MAKITEDKTLTPAEQVRLRAFVQEVWTTAYWDTEAIMGQLGEQAEIAAEILGYTIQKPDVDDDDEDWDDDTLPI